MAGTRAADSIKANYSGLLVALFRDDHALFAGRDLDRQQQRQLQVLTNENRALQGSRKCTH